MMISNDAAESMAKHVVAQALGVNVDSITPDMKLHDISSWDSFGQLRIVLALEEALHLEIKDPYVFNSLSSLSGIAEYLMIHL